MEKTATKALFFREGLQQQRLGGFFPAKYWRAYNPSKHLAIGAS
jgi:hypothetical protein